MQPTVSSHHNENIRARFHNLISQSDENFNLAEAALLIAAEEYPRLDVPLYLDKLENIAEHTHFRVGDVTAAPEMITAINETLFEELGFQGNRENYYDPRNSFLNVVLDRRTGIPITLSVVYIEIARRLNLPIHGIGLPGHFIVGYVTDTEEIYIDVFNGGRVLGVNGCADLVAGMSNGKLTFNSNKHLAPVKKTQILTRMLSNLLGIYVNSQDYRRSIACIERILLLMPNSLAHIRDYGLLLGQVGNTGKAIDQLERYLKASPQAADVEMIKAEIKKLRHEQARFN